MAGPLTGVCALDVTTVVLGPWAAQMLGDMGADVVKVEPPEGDMTRLLGPARHRGMAAFYLACNRNKRSIVLDLKQAAGRAALRRWAPRLRGDAPPRPRHRWPAPVARTPPPVEPDTWEATLFRLTGKDVTRCPCCGAAGFLIVEALPARAELRTFPWRGRSP